MSIPFDALAAELTGELARPGDELYDRLVTPWNVAVRPTPAAAVRAASAQDVVAAVRFAGNHGLPVAVQATGHGIAATLDGALLVHTGALDECSIHVEDGAGWARIGAGVQWERILTEAGRHGLTGLCGSAPDVGVVGYTTGGGVGPMARTFGLNSDKVSAFDVVTGDGELRRVTADQEPDLFWGLRGTKGALGIVTAMEFDLIDLPEFYGGALYFAGSDAAAVLHAWKGWSDALPLTGTTSFALLQLPPLEFVPPPLAGQFTVAVRFAWAGDAASGEVALAPMRTAGTVVLDGIGMLPAEQIGMVHADPVDPMPVVEGTDLLTDLPPAAIDALLSVAGPAAGSPQVIVEVRQLGGAVASGGAVPDAVSRRSTAAYNLMTVGVPMPDPAPIVAHGLQVRAALAPWATGHALPNWAAGDSPERLARSYDAATLARLTAVAEQYDPKAVFRVGVAAPR
jgi:hypothetical protein